MALQRIDVRVVSKSVSNMEYMIIQAARQKAQEGHDQNFMRLFVEEEISSWKKRDKWKNSKVELSVPSKWEMTLMNGKEPIVVFKTIA